MKGFHFHRDDDGTAALETVLIMPVLAFLLVVAFNLAPTPIKKIEAHCASRFAGTAYTRLLSVEKMRNGAGGFTHSAVAKAYKGVSVAIGDVPTIWTSPVGTFGNRIRVVSTTQAPRRIGRVVGYGPATSTFVIEGVTWTYDDIPISFGDLPSVLTELAKSFGSKLGLAQISGPLGTVFGGMLDVFGFLGRITLKAILFLVGC